VNLEVQSPAHQAKERDISFSFIAKPVIRPDHNRPGPNLLMNNVVDKIMGGHLSKFPGELDDDKNVDAGVLDELYLLFVGSNERRPVGGVKYPNGVWIEGHNYGFALEGSSQFFDALKKTKVSNMYTIEVAYGEHRIAKRLMDIVDAVDDFH
jgi:hypothetical protein